MSRTVQCRKYKKELPGLAVPPYPGPKGQEVYETVSEQAWQEQVFEICQTWEKIFGQIFSYLFY